MTIDASLFDKLAKQLGSATTKAIAPLISETGELINAIQDLRRDLRVLVGTDAGREALASIAAPPPAKEPMPELPPPPEYDMETIIREGGQWECGDGEGAISCHTCPVEQNVDCLITYKLLDGAPGEFKRDGVPHTEWDNKHLHAKLRLAKVIQLIQPARLTAGRVRVVPPLAMAVGAAPPVEEAPAPARRGRKPAPAVGGMKAPKEKPLEEMSRPELVKLAASLGVKDSTKRTKEDLAKQITKKRSK